MQATNNKYITVNAFSLVYAYFICQLHRQNGLDTS
jgi:hypothetical protein